MLKKQANVVIWMCSHLLVELILSIFTKKNILNCEDLEYTDVLVTQIL